MNKSLRIRDAVAFLTTVAALFCARLSAGDMDREGLLQKLRSLDESVLQTQTIVVEMEYPEHDVQLQYLGSTKRKITLTSDEGGMALESERRYLSEPVYRRGAERADYDKDGNYLVWRDIRTCALLEADLHAQRREQMLIRVTPQGGLIEQEGAPVVEFYAPVDLSQTFLDFMLPVWTTGRGFAKHLSRIIDVRPDQRSGLIWFRASGSFGPHSNGVWEISVDPGAGYLVRSGAFTPNEGVSASFVCTTVGTKWYDTFCLAEKATLKTGANIPPLEDNAITSATTNFTPHADVALFTRTRALFHGPLAQDTEIVDFRVTPVAQYRVGTLALPDRDLLDVAADATAVREDANHAASTQVSATSAAKDKPIGAMRREPAPPGARPNRNAHPYVVLSLVVVTLALVSIGAFYARKRARH